ncbi:MazG nucleotide pyrophosphohydrolase domain-containing protein [Corynebacterium sp.]|uniref:MazG nucleotide pyrophosphohydrolase domain-containing protein n=1 Tax=Corynebacterium sp. TaxID=1720 RepID=UPI0026DDAA0B|nr:MazG nucleotide pyrophosphohydrolase domain-containing protein [Corynebacterium sp.]MDO4914569.1 MazG nucleotide pyrophosphohydrolase domain-containing protein [Corynebacterium sp.]
MSVIVLDPRFPGMLPVDAVSLVGNDVCYTEEVPVRIRWVIADLGGHVVDDTDTLITTDPYNEWVRERLHSGDQLLVAPSLYFQRRPDRALASGSTNNALSSGASGELEGMDADNPAAYPDYDFALKAIPQLTDGAETSEEAYGEDSSTGEPDYPSDQRNGEDQGGTGNAGGGVIHGTAVVGDGVDSEGTDDESAGGVDETTESADGSGPSQSEIPEAVLNEIEEAISVMSRALRQGEWEQSQSHQSLLAYLREEVEELAQSIDTWQAGDLASEKRLCDELSDIFLQVLFHAEIANRRGAFDIGHVAASFVHKMRTRAPYLFEETERPVGLDEQNRLWEEGKRREQSAANESWSAPASHEDLGS